MDERETGKCCKAYEIVREIVQVRLDQEREIEKNEKRSRKNRK